MKNLISLIFIFTLVAGTLNAQEETRAKRTRVSLSGTITDAKTGEVLPGASVYLADDKTGGSADATGHYRISNLSQGHHIVEISHAGYATQVVHLEISTDMQKDFQLSTVILENQGVIVTGVSSATSMRKTPVPVSSVRKTQLLQSASSNIIDALTHVPGVSQLSTGPAVSKPFIRGLGYNRVVVVNDGVRQEGQQWGDEHGIEMDELSVGRVEVLKGPASLMYGSDALAGVIHFIANSPVPAGTLKGNLYSNYQSNNSLYAFNANLAGNENGFNWNVYGTYKSSGDYKNKYDGKVLNSRFNEKNFGGYAGINKSWGYSHFIFSHFNQHLGLVEGERDINSGRFILFSGTPMERVAGDEDLRSRDLFVPFQWVRHNKFTLDNSFSAGQSRLKLNVGYQQNLRQEYGNPTNALEKSLAFDLKTFNYHLQWQLPEKKEWHTSVGINGMQQANQNKGLETLIPEYALFDVGMFLYSQRIFKKATWSGGLRFDNRSVHSDEFFDGPTLKFRGFKRNFSNVSGSVGVSMEPSPALTLKLNMARGFRAPTLAEMASNGAHEGTNRYEYGFQDLKSEKSLQADAGIDINNEHFNIGISTFYNRIRDFIFYRKLASVSGFDSLVNVNGDFIPAYQFDQQHASLVGFEASFDLHPHPLDWLHVENTVSFVRGKFDDAIDGTNNLPLIPPATFISELRGDFKKAGKSLQNFYVKLEADNTFKQSHAFTAYGTETETPGYTLWHTGTGADIINRNKKIIFSLHLSANNIFDKAYQNHLSRLKYTAVNNITGRQGVFNTGRNFSIKLNVPLEFTTGHKQ